MTHGDDNTFYATRDRPVTAEGFEFRRKEGWHEVIVGDGYGESPHTIMDIGVKKLDFMPRLFTLKTWP